mgnify:CR=1 FL=1
MPALMLACRHTGMDGNRHTGRDAGLPARLPGGWLPTGPRNGCLTNKKEESMKKECVLLADGFEEIEGLTVVDLLRRAKIYVDTVSIMDDYIVHGAHGINVQTEDLFDEVDFEEFDMVVLPGGMPGTLNLKEHDGVRYVVKQYAKEGRFVGAICAAPTILKSLGLLEGRRATCYPGVEDEMENVILTETAVVVDDNIITSQGVGTAIDFALKLIEVLDGEEKAKEIAESIVF